MTNSDFYYCSAPIPKLPPGTASSSIQRPPLVHAGWRLRSVREVWWLRGVFWASPSFLKSLPRICPPLPSAPQFLLCTTHFHPVPPLTIVAYFPPGSVVPVYANRGRPGIMPEGTWSGDMWASGGSVHIFLDLGEINNSS